MLALEIIHNSTGENAMNETVSIDMTMESLMPYLNFLIDNVNAGFNKHVKMQLDSDMEFDTLSVQIVIGDYETGSLDNGDVYEYKFSDINELVTFIKSCTSTFTNNDDLAEFSYYFDDNYIVYELVDFLLAGYTPYNIKILGSIGSDHKRAHRLLYTKRLDSLSKLNEFTQLQCLCKSRGIVLYHDALFNSKTTDFCHSQEGTYSELAISLNDNGLFKTANSAKEMIEIVNGLG